MSFTTKAKPLVVAFCHCSDCKRWTGAPAPAFAAFREDALAWLPALSEPIEKNTGVKRWNCPKCFSPLAASFDYIGGQVYVPLGIVDGGDQFPASLHCHSENEWTWLCLDDKATRQHGTALDVLNTAKDEYSGI